MTKQGMLIVVSGPSGVGKDTVVNRYLEDNTGCVLSVSATTRDMRFGEAEGKDYFFITRERFSELVSRGEMLEYAEYGGNYYGTPKEMVEREQKAGRDVILVIEVQGAMQVKKIKPDALFVFIMPPSIEELRSRLEHRGTESEQSVANRMRAAENEIAMAHEYDYILVNNTITQCLGDFRAVVSAAHHSAGRMVEQMKEIMKNA